MVGGNEGQPDQQGAQSRLRNIRWWGGPTGLGTAVLNGTMAQSRFERQGQGEMTATAGV